MYILKTMQTVKTGSRWIFAAPCLIVAVALGMAACAPGAKFSVFRLYGKKGFTGNDLSGQRILISPLITRTGFESGGALTSGAIAGAASDKRPDLRFEKSDDFMARYRARHGEEDLERICQDFFQGAMVSLQTNTGFWTELNSDYLMVLKLTYGLKTRSVGKETTRQMRIEGELWECDSLEVVWRAVVEGRCKGDLTTDTDLILKAVSRLIEVLPPVTRGYGRGEW
jgi:hypothetical protein